METYRGKIGLMIEASNQFHLVVSSHLLTQTVAAAQSDLFPGNIWKDGVSLIARNGGQKVRYHFVKHL
jgi:hypothetical protein